MYGILCKLCGWPESDHGGLPQEDSEDEQYHKPQEGYECPLINQEGLVDHEYDSSDPKIEKKHADREQEERAYTKLPITF